MYLFSDLRSSLACSNAGLMFYFNCVKKEKSFTQAKMDKLHQSRLPTPHLTEWRVWPFFDYQSTKLPLSSDLDYVVFLSNGVGSPTPTEHIHFLREKIKVKIQTLWLPFEASNWEETYMIWLLLFFN